MPLVLPAHIEREQLVNQAVNSDLAVIDEYNRELEKIDDRLRLIFCGDRFQGIPGVVPNRWHVVRLARPGTREIPAFKPILDVDGGFMEPSPMIFEQLRNMDLWGPSGISRLKRENAEIAASRQRRLDAERAEAREETELRFKSLLSPGIRFGGSWQARLPEARRVMRNA